MTILEGHSEGGFEVEIGLKFQQLCGESQLFEGAVSALTDVRNVLESGPF
jgi:hypothetical protein